MYLDASYCPKHPLFVSPQANKNGCVCSDIFSTHQVPA